jgi:hypothetical protein
MQPWTIGGFLASMLDTFMRRPLAVVFVLGVLPAAWFAPASMFQAALIPEDTPLFGPGRSLKTVVVSWLVSAWGCVWYAGQISAALALARREDVRWYAFLTGVRKAPALFVAGLVTLAPLEALQILPLPTEGTANTLATIVAGALTALVFARTISWSLLVVASSHSLWTGLVASWSATRGHALKLIALGMILFAMVLPLVVVEAALSSEHFHASASLISALYLLALGQLGVLNDKPVASVPAFASDFGENGSGQSIPEHSNFHLAVRGKQSPAEIAEMFRNAGWTTRKCAWNEFEVKSPIAELVIEGAPVVVHGSIADPLKTIDFVLAPLIGNEIDGFCECYGPDRTLLFKRDFGTELLPVA